MLLGILHTTLNTLAATLDAVTESLLHLLELPEDKLHGGIDGILHPRAASVVERIWLHGLMNLIPNVSTKH
jgi:hypothetical protein